MATEATREAFVELQGRLVETDSKLKQVLGQEKACEVDVFTARTTLDELQELATETNVYQSIVPCLYPRRNVGIASAHCMQAPALHPHLACHLDRHLDIASLSSSQQHIRMLPLAQPTTRFVLQPLEEARATEEGKIKEAEATIASLQGSKKYLEKQMREVQSNFKELMEQLPASIPGLSQAING
ncbi:unnamed protein product [Closterium sp. Naga37s-1]|nr:unnamed protein product [Closterium sp. Naga37s-1]